MRQLRDRLQDILEAVAQIETERAKGKPAFDSSPLVQVWMVHHLMRPGNCVRLIRKGIPALPDGPGSDEPGAAGLWPRVACNKPFLRASPALGARGPQYAATAFNNAGLLVRHAHVLGVFILARILWPA